MISRSIPLQPPPSVEPAVEARPLRPAWIEIDQQRLERNFQLICQDKPPGLEIMSVIKDEAYGHGALTVAQTALRCGTKFFAVGTLDEALVLREQGIRAPILLLGERPESELPWCLQYDLTCCVNEPQTVDNLARLASSCGRQVAVHLKVNTGMNRYGVRWTEALPLLERICNSPALRLEGMLSHFAMSDEPDKSFANLQLERFRQILARLQEKGIRVPLRHLCNSGGFLDLPQAHFDMVRLGMLPLGIYPSKTCRRIPGLEPVMTVKARIAALQFLEKDDLVGYGMRYQAPGPRRIAVVPIGYGDGFPRLRNQGFVLVGGRRAPLVGGVAMDAFMVDTTGFENVALGDEVVLMGRQGADEISVHEVAQWKNSVSYDVLTGWRARLPRISVNGAGAR